MCPAVVVYVMMSFDMGVMSCWEPMIYIFLLICETLFNLNDQFTSQHLCLLFFDGQIVKI